MALIRVVFLGGAELDFESVDETSPSGSLHLLELS